MLPDFMQRRHHPLYCVLDSCHPTVALIYPFPLRIARPSTCFLPTWFDQLSQCSAEILMTVHPLGRSPSLQQHHTRHLQAWMD